MVDVDAYAYTDLGNAERFADMYCGDIIYCEEQKVWYAWDGRRWRVDVGELQVYNRYYDMLQRMRETISHMPENGPHDRERRKEFKKHVMNSESGNRIRESIKLSRSVSGMSMSRRIFDRYPKLLNVENGTLNLDTMELVPHDRSHYITQVAPVSYDPDARCPMWEQYLEDTFRDPDIIEYVQRVTGYTITGLTDEQCVFILYGKGSNGKTVYVQVLKMLLGDDYAQSADSRTFMKQANSSNIRNDIAIMLGARLITAVETSEGEELDAALVKWVSGGDTIRARLLYSESYEFDPVMKIHIATNYLPTVRGADLGIWRRLRVVPFEYTVDPNKVIPQLQSILVSQEGSGILNWALAGAQMWMDSGLNPPKEIVEAHRTYRTSQNPIEVFAEEMLILDKDATTPVQVVFDWYQRWCADTNQESIDRVELFSKKLLSTVDQIKSVRLPGKRSPRGYKGCRMNVTMTAHDLSQGD